MMTMIWMLRMVVVVVNYYEDDDGGDGVAGLQSRGQCISQISYFLITRKGSQRLFQSTWFILGLLGHENHKDQHLIPSRE